ncbi:UNVERIFIED_CONTAM: hypothetical protein GTU68_037172 [Idotea baltica]|nr:hypothetical protein [Idotea baltica]
MHLGNYLGATKNWVDLQKDYACFFGIVDNHATTMPYNPDKLRENTWNMAFQLLAVGVQPENLFVQSLIPEHTELCWILSCVSAYGETARMTQFKDKSEQVKTTNKDAHVSAGLFLYPILQAADILLYHPDFVPVGKDQEQHLELTRSIADRFNHQFKKEYFKHVDGLYTPNAKILSFADPSRKMSKSAGEKHYLSIFEEEAKVRKQVKSAVTDSGDPVDGVMAPGVKNLFDIILALGDHTDHERLMGDYNTGQLKYSDLKGVVADTLVDFTSKCRAQMTEIKDNKKEYKNQILESSAVIRKQAQATVKEVRAITGLLNLK